MAPIKSMTYKFPTNGMVTAGILFYNTNINNTAGGHMKNWFPTLNDALESEGLVEYWPLGENINYGETKRFVKDGKFLSVYRDERGMYERPVHYASMMENTI